jgi:acyl-coenzyme A thioesterase PaaI-like protein
MEGAAKKRHFWDIPDALPEGAWASRRRLADALRELIATCVTAEAEDEELARAADIAEALAGDLRGRPHSRFKDGFLPGVKQEELTKFADRALMVGRSNPMSPLMTFTMAEESAVAKVTFGVGFEGLPGCVHGGMVAAAFDQTFGYLQVGRAVASVTGTLTVKYRSVTPLETELTIEAGVARIEGRKTYLAATMTANGQVTATAESLFVALDSQKLHAILDREAKGTTEH